MASPNTPDTRSGSAADQAKAAGADAKAAAASVADDAKKAASDAADQAKSAASDLAQTAKSEAADLAQQAKHQATDKAEQAKGQATGVLSDVAEALHDTSDSLRDHDQDAFARYADQAATQVEQFTSAVRDRSVGELLDEAERFARRDPGLFLGGAFLLGIFGARFLKASTPDRGGSSRLGTSGSASGATRYGAGAAGSYGSGAYGSASGGAGRTLAGTSAATRTVGRTTGDPFPTGAGAGTSAMSGSGTTGGSMDRALSPPLTPGTATAGTSGGAGTDRTTS